MSKYKIEYCDEREKWWVKRNGENIELLDDLPSAQEFKEKQEANDAK